MKSSFLFLAVLYSLNLFCLSNHLNSDSAEIDPNLDLDLALEEIDSTCNYLFSIKDYKSVSELCEAMLSSHSFKDQPLTDISLHKHKALAHYYLHEHHLCNNNSRYALDVSLNNDLDEQLPYLYFQYGLSLVRLSELDSASKYYDLSIEESRKQKDSVQLQKTLRAFADNHIRTGKYELSISAAEESYSIAKSLQDSIQMGWCKLLLGTTNFHYGKYDVAAKELGEALFLSELIEDYNLKGSAQINLGLIHMNLNDTAQAKQNFLKGYESAKKANQHQHMANALGNLATLAQRKGNHTKALEYNLKCLEIELEFGSKTAIAGTYINIGNCYQAMGDNSQNLEYLNKALSLQNEIGYPLMKSYILRNIGEIYATNGNHNKAIEYFNQCLTIDTTLKNLSSIQQSYEALFRSQEALGNYQAAFQNYQQYNVATDSLLRIENQRAALASEIEFEYQKQALADSLDFAKAETLKNLEIEKQQAELSKQRVGLAATGGSLLLIVALAFSIYKGKKRSDELLLNILPEETAKELKAKGSAESKLIEDTTVLFTDFEGFTALSEKVSASELVEDMNKCFSAFDHIMVKYNVEKIKTIGDAYMAAGGLPRQNSTHAKDVVLAALEIAKFMKEWAHKKDANNEPHFDIRIGINTGPVVAGIVGVKKFQYDIWGDTVNTASRMESTSHVGKVNISESTYLKLKDEPEFTFDFRGDIEAKGKGKMKMWFVSRA